MNPLRYLTSDFAPIKSEPKCKTDRKGNKRWYLKGELHREDGPAIEYANGTKQWFRNGVLHRADGPAVEWANGTKEWRRNGLRHREDGPAIEHANGDKEWWLKGEQVKIERVKFNEIALRQASALAVGPSQFPVKAVAPSSRRFGLNL